MITGTAARLFAERGYAAVSIDDIATEFRVTRGAIYYYFESKADILGEIVRSGMTVLEQNLDDALRTDGPPSNVVREIIGSHAESVVRHTDVLRVLNLERHEVAKWTGEETRTRMRKYTNRIVELVRRAFAEAGSALDPKVATYAAIAVCNSPVNWYSPRGKVSEREMIDVHTELALRVLGLSR